MNWLSRLLPGRAATPELDPATRERLAHWRAIPLPDLSRTHGETRYVVLNTHASGLDIDSAKLLSIGGVAVDSGRIALSDGFHASVGDNPRDMLVDLLEFTRAGPVVVFNAAFNRTLIERAFETHLGLTPEWTWLDLYWLLPLLFSEHHLDPTRLANWMQALGIDTFQRFHALGDAYALARMMLLVEARALAKGHASARSLIDLEHARRQAERT